MAEKPNKRRLQLLRNTSIADSYENALQKLNTQVQNAIDGEPFLCRYKATVGDDEKVITLLAIASVQKSADDVETRGYTLIEGHDNVMSYLNALDYKVTAEDGEFITAFEQVDGKITSHETGSLTSENKSISVNNFDLGVNISDQDRFLQINGNDTHEGLMATFDVVKTSPTEQEGQITQMEGSNILESYAIVDKSGRQVGCQIPVYKDRSVKEVHIGNPDNDDMSVTVGEGETRPKESDQKLYITYTLEDGSETTVCVDFSAFVAEAEAGDGLAVAANGQLNVVKSGTSENFLKIYGDSIAIEGVQDAINLACTNLAVTAEGDDYVSASVNGSSDPDNKKVSVKTNIENVTGTAGTRGSWAVDDDGKAILTGEVAPTLSGVAKSLMDGSQAIAAIKTYVDAKVAIEAAERKAKIEGAVKSLDVTEIAAAEGEYIEKISETDGKIAASTKAFIGDITVDDNKNSRIPPTTAAVVSVIEENELVTAESFNAVKTALGIAGEQLQYEPNSGDEILAAATTYSEADNLLAAAIEALANNEVIQSLTSSAQTMDCGEY